MKKHNLVCLTFILLIFFSHASTKISAAELIVNGGFENATAFFGWTVSPFGNQTWYPWQVTAAGGGDCFTGNIQCSSPLFGTRSAWNGFCCNTNPNPEFIYQDVTLPANQTASLQWSEKIQSNLTNFCTVPACGANTFRVQILNPSTNAVLQTLYTVIAEGGANYNTGWQSHGVNISSFAGQTIRIRFATSYTGTMPRNENGPGRAEIDGVSLQVPAVVPTSSEVSISGYVRSSSGGGVRNIPVILSDVNGNTRSTMTNSFGAYQFDNLQAGQTYFVSVSSKRYMFSNQMQAVTVNQSVSDVDFISIE